MALAECFDASNLDSRPNKNQQKIFDDIEKVQYRWVVAGNQSGKSALAAREIAWILNDNHPKWKRPERWGTEPLLVLIAGQDRKMMEIELWGKKLAPFLNQTEWREVRQGGSLQQIVNRKTNDTIAFLSHSDSSEKNRKHMQGYVAHYVWLDEMPASITILEELQRRVDAKEGYLVATFTPKFKNSQIKRVVDAGKPPLAKKYSMSKLDNPIYADRIQQEIDKLEGYSESYKRTILYGEWNTGDSAVYEFDADSMVSDPTNYSRGWRHVLSVDPAMAGKAGASLWAESPEDNRWYLVREEYVEGKQAPSDLVDAIEQLAKGYNIVRRISDPHESWYIGAASKLGYRYIGVYKKNDRKKELIKNLQTSLFEGVIKVSSWCTKIQDEFLECQWSETVDDKIINSSKFHLLDTAQYFIDLKPKGVAVKPNQTWEGWLKEEHRKQLKKESTTKLMKAGRLKRGKQWKRKRPSFSL